MTNVVEVQKYSLYPLQVRLYQTDVPLVINERIIEKIEKYFGVLKLVPSSHRLRNSLLALSEKDEVIRTLQEIFNKATKQYFDDVYEPDLLENFDIIQDWSTVLLREGAMMASHTHQECILTLIYYPETADAMFTPLIHSGLQDRRTGQLAVSDIAGKAVWNRFQKDKGHLPLLITPKAGLVAAVPGSMPHFTIPGEFRDRYAVVCFITCQTKTTQPMDLS